MKRPFFVIKVAYKPIIACFLKKYTKDIKAFASKKIPFAPGAKGIYIFS